MSRRYSDPIEVRCVEPVAADRPRPVAFLWHGRVYLVRDVLSQWVEAGSWWRTTVGRLALGADPGRPAAGRSVVALGGSPSVGDGAAHPPGDGHVGRPDAHVGRPGDASAPETASPAGDRWVWRVEAAAGRSAAVGVYDLSCRDGEWRLARALD